METLTPQQRGERRRFHMMTKEHFDLEEQKRLNADSPNIDIGKVRDQGIYAILVLWLHGFSILQILRGAMHSFGRFWFESSIKLTEGVVQSVCRSRKNGGLLPKNRSEMTQEDRQRLLDQLKSTRIDNGKLPDWCFTAIALKAKTQDGTVTRARRPREMPESGESYITQTDIDEMFELKNKNQKSMI